MLNAVNCIPVPAQITAFVGRLLINIGDVLTTFTRTVWLSAQPPLTPVTVYVVEVAGAASTVAPIDALSPAAGVQT